MIIENLNIFIQYLSTFFRKTKEPKWTNFDGYALTYDDFHSKPMRCENETNITFSGPV